MQSIDEWIRIVPRWNTRQRPGEVCGGCPPPAMACLPTRLQWWGSFPEAPAAGGPRRPPPEVSGCGYWRRPADGNHQGITLFGCFLGARSAELVVVWLRVSLCRRGDISALLAVLARVDSFAEQLGAAGELSLMVGQKSQNGVSWFSDWRPVKCLASRA